MYFKSISKPDSIVYDLHCVENDILQCKNVKNRCMQTVTQSCNFSFLFHFSMKIMSANRKTQDRMPRFAASHLGYSVCLCSIKGRQLYMG